MEREETKATTIGDKMEKIVIQNGQVTRPAVEKYIYLRNWQTNWLQSYGKIDTVLRSVVA